MLDANFVLLFIFMILNFLLCLKRIPEDLPLINILFALFTIIISVTVFLPDVNIPANPLISAFVALLGVIQLIISVLSTKV